MKYYKYLLYLICDLMDKSEIMDNTWCNFFIGCFDILVMEED